VSAPSLPTGKWVWGSEEDQGIGVEVGVALSSLNGVVAAHTRPLALVQLTSGPISTTVVVLTESLPGSTNEDDVSSPTGCSGHLSP
jgi:hypothetical protein